MLQSHLPAFPLPEISHFISEPWFHVVFHSLNGERPRTLTLYKHRPATQQQTTLRPECQQCHNGETPNQSICTHMCSQTVLHVHSMLKLTRSYRVLQLQSDITGFIPLLSNPTSVTVISDRGKLGFYYTEYMFLLLQPQNMHKLVSELLTHRGWKTNLTTV